MYKFIYVFSKEQSEDLIKKGYKIIKSDKKNNVYVFENKGEQKMDFSEQSAVFSNTLTFS